MIVYTNIQNSMECCIYTTIVIHIFFLGGLKIDHQLLLIKRCELTRLNTSPL